MQPHDLIRMHGRIWELEGVHLGGLGEEGVYALRTLDRSPAHVQGIGIRTMTVPCVMLDRLCETGEAEHYRLLNVDAVLQVRDEQKIARIREAFGSQPAGSIEKEETQS